jgi:hypothetical protein
MNQDIVNSIVEGYKTKGVDMHTLLADPLFLSLPLDKQVEAVQIYAPMIANGSRTPGRSKIMAKAVLSGAGAGFFSSMPFMSKVKTPLMAGVLGAAGAILGGTVGAISGNMMYNSDRGRRETTNKYLIRLSKSPDVPTAVKVLDVNRRFEPITLKSLIARAASPETPLIEKIVSISEGAGKTQAAIKLVEGD